MVSTVPLGRALARPFVTHGCAAGAGTQELDEGRGQAIIRANLSRMDDANVRPAPRIAGAAPQPGGSYTEDVSDIERIPPSAVGSIAGRVEMVRQPLGDSRVADENERARLIADIARLIREPTVPEPTRVAGLTLIGWLARRRPEESPHAIGVSEALESERRLRAAK